jgi:hypothetical protein
MLELPTATITSSQLILSLIRLDGKTQNRVALNESSIVAYAGLMAEGVEFPPVRVWFDGEEYWLSDGFHRVEAARRAGLHQIAVEIIQGTLADAQWDSFSANATHGIRRTRADLNLIISRALGHQRATGIRTNCLARHIGIPESTLRRWRNATSSQVDEDRSPVRIVARNGTTYQMDTSRIGFSVSCGRPLRAGHRLARELEEMKSAAPSTEIRRILAILDKWFKGLLDSRAVIEGLGKIGARESSFKTPSLNVSRRLGV